MRLTEKVRKHKRTIIYVLLTGVFIFGLARVENIADEAHDTAVAFEEAEKREDAEDRKETFLACQQRNSFQRNSREGDARIIDAFEAAFLASAETDQAKQAVNAAADMARQRVFDGRSPEIEDRDCNGDKTLTAVDYLP